MGLNIMDAFYIYTKSESAKCCDILIADYVKLDQGLKLDHGTLYGILYQIHQYYWTRGKILQFGKYQLAAN